MCCLPCSLLRASTLQAGNASTTPQPPGLPPVPLQQKKNKKKGRGPLRGPMHKLAKEVRRVRGPLLAVPARQHAAGRGTREAAYTPEVAPFRAGLACWRSGTAAELQLDSRA